jgi:nitronate monooxygenase
MRRLEEFRMRLGQHDLAPIMIGGMGVDISSADLALEAARLGGVGHISDAMIKTVTDRRYKTKYVKAKQAMYKYVPKTDDKSNVKFNLEHLAEATRLHVEGTMKRKQGPGLIFINCMEKLTMNGPKETLQVRMRAALDAGHRRHHTGRRFALGFVCAH